jgi:hypothetical protein
MGILPIESCTTAWPTGVLDRIDGTIQDRSRQKPLRTVPSTLAAGALRNKSRYAHDVQRLANIDNCQAILYVYYNEADEKGIPMGSCRFGR